MLEPIRPRRLNHLNIVCEDFDRSMRVFTDAYDAEFMAEIPGTDWRAGLFNIGRTIFEIFVPHQFLLNARYGSHFLGLEYQADMDEVREAIAARGIRIIRDVGMAVHTHPADTFGVAFEFYAGYFHDREWPLLGGKIGDAEEWATRRPLGITGLKAVTLAARDGDAAQAFLASFLGAVPEYEAAREAIGARAVGLRVADMIFEVVTPVADSRLSEHLRRFGDGIRSAVFEVTDVGRARDHLVAHGLTCGAGGMPGSFAVHADGSAGILFEFSE